KAFVMVNIIVTHSPYRAAPLPAFLKRYPQEAPPAVAPSEIWKYATLYRNNHLALSEGFPDTVKRLGLSEEDITKMASVVERLYRSNVADLDTVFGQVVDAIRSRGLLPESLIVFTADHGEALYRANVPFKWAHSGQLAPE